MTEHVPNPHTPEQDRILSNVGHWIEGATITAAAAALLPRPVGEDERYDLRAARLLLGAGGLLGLGLIAGSFHHGGPRVFFTSDRQQRQHLQMAGLITAAGAARGLGRVGALASNALIARVGQMFLTHEQHGTDKAAAEAKAKHQRLGQTIVAGSALGAVGDLTRARTARRLGALMTMAAGLQLLTYREPEGAFEASTDHSRVVDRH